MVRQFFKSLSYLVFPNLCIACLKEAALDDQLFCIKCMYQLPDSDMHHRQENQFTERLVGIEGIETGAANYLFYEGGAIGEILHKIKYRGRKDIALTLGRDYGKKLVGKEYYSDINYLIPVPLHRNRFKKRGYNQSEEVCRGLSESMAIPTMSDNLLRIVDTKTQTKLSKAERQHNLKDAFVVKYPEKLGGKHLLLVDDVLTTGATVEECSKVLRAAVPNVRISIVTLAIRVYQ